MFIRTRDLEHSMAIKGRQAIGSKFEQSIATLYDRGPCHVLSAGLVSVCDVDGVLEPVIDDVVDNCTFLWILEVGRLPQTCSPSHDLDLG